MTATASPAVPATPDYTVRGSEAWANRVVCAHVEATAFPPLPRDNPQGRARALVTAAGRRRIADETSAQRARRFATFALAWRTESGRHTDAWGANERAIDDCFEMWDGRAVAVALAALVARDAVLAAHVRGVLNADWREAAARDLAEATAIVRAAEARRPATPMRVPFGGGQFLLTL